ncbi:MAG TPA: hypothetical protein VF258_04415 [Luteolibacter sp.]
MIGRSIKIVIAGMLLAASASVDARIWTNALGRTFEAEFVRMDGVNVIFTMPNGRAFSTPLVELSAADQAVLRTGKAPQPAAMAAASMAVAAPSTFHRPWPREIRLDGPVACKVVSEDAKARRYIYESPGYRFTCDARVTDDALRNFSVMFEATRKYAQNLPLSLGGGGRERQGKLDILLFGSMDQYVKAGGPPSSAGCYSRGVVLVPMTSLGLKEGGTGFSLDTSQRNNVLIHELAHQLTPDVYMATGASGWFSEGLAEYLAITPYNWGYYQPDVHGNSVKTYVTGRSGLAGMGGRVLGENIKAPRLKDFMLMPYSKFSGPNANFNYGVGLLLTHYFFHMEGGGKAARITQFLKGLQAGHQGEAALAPLLGGSTFEKLEGEIAAAWARQGVQIKFGG